MAKKVIHRELVIKRTYKALDLLKLKYPDNEIAEMLRIEFGIATATAYDDIRRAKSKYKKKIEAEANHIIDEMIKSHEVIELELIRNKDYKLLIEYRQEKARLLNLYKPTESKITIDSNTLSPEETIKRAKEILNNDKG